MGWQFKNPKFSFIQFSESDPSGVDGCGICLPLFDNSDLYFQWFIDTGTEDVADDIMGYPEEAVELSMVNKLGEVYKNFTVDNELFFEKYRIGPKRVLFLWKNDLGDFQEGDAGVGYGVPFWFKIGGQLIDDLEYYSNPFIRISEEDVKYTSQLEYWNEDDYADFVYCGKTDAVNRIRLPLYLSRPKFIEDKVVYRKSSGLIKQTKSILTKEYAARTDYMTEELHEKLSVLLAHDFINVRGEVYIGGVSKSSDYDIEWQEDIDHCIAPAKFSAMATPYAIRNNNCNSCGSDAGCAKLVYPEGIYFDTVYSKYWFKWKTLFDTGGLGFIIEFKNNDDEWVALEWDEIELNEEGNWYQGSVLETGDLDPGSDCVFRITPFCNDESDLGEPVQVNYFHVIEDCEKVEFESGEPVLPTNVTSETWNVSFNIKGTGPFTFVPESDAVNPGEVLLFWLSVTIHGWKVLLVGTPPNESEENISFSIENCGGDDNYINVSQTVTIL